MDADVFDLHRPKIELAGAPGILITAARTAMIEGRDEQAVLALVIDDRGVTRATRSSASSHPVGCIWP